MSGPNKRRALLTGALLSGVYCNLLRATIHRSQGMYCMYVCSSKISFMLCEFFCV